MEEEQVIVRWCSSEARMMREARVACLQPCEVSEQQQRLVESLEQSHQVKARQHAPRQRDARRANLGGRQRTL